MQLLKEAVTSEDAPNGVQTKLLDGVASELTTPPKARPFGACLADGLQKISAA